MNNDYYNIDPQNKLLNVNVRYKKTVEVLLYISTITRIGVSASVNILGRRNEKLREAD